MSRQNPPPTPPRIFEVAALTALAPHLRLAIRLLRERERRLATIFAATDAELAAEAAAALGGFVVELDGVLEGEPDADFTEADE